jgi:hypothetical protein
MLLPLIRLMRLTLTWWMIFLNSFQFFITQMSLFLQVFGAVAFIRTIVQ